MKPPQPSPVRRPNTGPRTARTARHGCRCGGRRTRFPWTGGCGCAHEIRFNLVAELKADPALPVTLVISIYKFDRMEWAIEKATELGVAAIAPVIARRTEKHLAHGRVTSVRSAGAASRMKPRSSRGDRMCR